MSHIKGPYARVKGPYARVKGPYARVKGTHARVKEPHARVKGTLCPCKGNPCPCKGNLAMRKDQAKNIFRIYFSFSYEGIIGHDKVTTPLHQVNPQVCTILTSFKSRQNFSTHSFFLFFLN